MFGCRQAIAVHVASGLERACTDYMPLPVTGSTSRNRSQPISVATALYMRTDRSYMACEINPNDQGGCYSTLSNPPKSAPALTYLVKVTSGDCSRHLCWSFTRQRNYHCHIKYAAKPGSWPMFWYIYTFSHISISRNGTMRDQNVPPPLMAHLVRYLLSLNILHIPTIQPDRYGH